MTNRMHDIGGIAYGVLAYGVGVVEGLPVLQIAGLIVGGIAACAAVSREIREWVRWWEG